MKTNAHDRRRFLKRSAALAGLAVGAVRSAGGQTLGDVPREVSPDELRAYGKRSRFVTTYRGQGNQGGLTSPIQNQHGIITPTSLHFYTGHTAEPPDIDPQKHRLMIHGMVDRPLSFTMEELMCLPAVSRIHFVQCGGNSGTFTWAKGAETAQQMHGCISCSEWTGVLLSVLLKEVGVQRGASWLVAEGAEAPKHSMTLPLEKAMDDIIVAYGQNGEPLRPENGYPVRLVVPGWAGVRNIKWLRRIKVGDKAWMTKWESTAYSTMRRDGKAEWFNWEAGSRSVITRPSGGQRVPGPGFFEITGLAWSGVGTIRRVEVSTDGGRTWKDAQLQEPVHRMAHTVFRSPWNWDGQETVLMSRCTDEKGVVERTVAELGAIVGNYIQPWKVNRDGSVRNALWETGADAPGLEKKYGANPVSPRLELGGTRCCAPIPPLRG